MSIALIDHSADLRTLADTANREHGLAEDAGLSMLEHAIRAGEALNAAKELVQPGEWVDWIRAEFVGSVATANAYRRFAVYKETLVEARAASKTEATRVLQQFGLELSPARRDTGCPEIIRTTAVARIRSGESYATVASDYGLHTSTLWRWVNPERKKEIARRRELKVKRARAALLREERDRLARRAGGSIEKAYSLVRQLSQALDEAGMSEEEPIAKTAIASALREAYKAEDEIVRALGGSTRNARGSARSRAFQSSVARNQHRSL